MPRSNKTIVNTVGGELSPQMYGRLDLPIFAKGLAKCENFVCLPQGGARYRNGTSFVRYTRLNRKAVLIPFQFSDQQAYLLELTAAKMRFYKDNAIITEATKTITAMTNANPGVFTSATHGFTTGDEVYIDTLVGPTGINGKFYLVNVLTVNTFSLTDIFGTVLNTTASGARTSGGTAARVYEVTTPYAETDLEYVQFAQSADTMYLANQNYEPRKLTRQGHASWTLATYVRTSDPFVSSVKTLSAVTNANPGVFTSAAHGISDSVRVSFTGVTGMTQLNGNQYLTANVTTNTFTLTDLDGVAINTSAFGVFAAGDVTIADKYPAAVSFTDSSRLIFGGTRGNPQTFYSSKAPSSGTTDFDNFTTGTAATDAVVATITPTHGKVDAIQWIDSTSKSTVLGTFSTLRRLYGATEQEPFSPTDINVKSVNAFGCAKTRPISNGQSLFYIQRAGILLRSLEYDYQIDGYTTVDRNLVAEHLSQPGLKNTVEQQSTPDVIWITRYDGKFIGLTFKDKEDISGWHRHYLGGSHVNTKGITQRYGKVLWAGIMLRSSQTDQLWLVVERYINGQTVRSVEYINDQPIYQIRSDFNTAEDGETVDARRYLNALYETQKDACHLDMSIAFDGTATGRAANASITPSAMTGTGVTITASAAVFTAAMVGRQIWKQYDLNGDGGGRATIKTYVSPTEVTADVIDATGFNSLDAIAAGSWFLTATTISGLDHLEGLTVSTCVDGGYGGTAVVTAGSITLSAAASKAIIGLGYRGTIETLNIDSGGVLGSAQAKIRNLISTALRFLNTIGAKFGTNIYKLDSLTFQSTAGIADRPPPPFTGVKVQAYSDSWEFDNKSLIVVQDRPLPCTVQVMDLFLDTTDE